MPAKVYDHEPPLNSQHDEVAVVADPDHIQEQVLPQPPRWHRGHPVLLAVLVLLVTVLGLFVFFFIQYSRLVDRKLAAGVYENQVVVFAAPRSISVGDVLTPNELIEQLQQSGYSDSPDNQTGWYKRSPNALDITCGPQSYFGPYTTRIEFKNDRIMRIQSDQDPGPGRQYLIEPELVTNVNQGSREKRRLVTYRELPPQLVDALLAVEDKRFFQHPGFDLRRIGGAIYVDLRQGRKDQGASTITMQLARNFFLDLQKTWRRKAAEAMLTFVMEAKLSKEQILEFYSNQIYLGRRGSFSIHGFGEAARSYFSKDLSEISLAEAAMLAGLVQRPAYLNPFLYPERIKVRRDLVLRLMRDNGKITPDQYRQAVAEPVQVTKPEMESSDAPYFVDVVNDELGNIFPDRDFKSGSVRIYTSIDMNLQREAAAAIQAGMKEVDDQLRKRKQHKDGAVPQVALVALDPQTGAIKALVGGRSYMDSQLNHALAKRQPGSIFKPFVYAAAFDATAKGRTNVTPATVLADVPTVFRWGRGTYEPSNFHQQFHGNVPVRTALAKSLNIPTVRVAEMVGYGNVAALAKSAGMNERIDGTPAVALGAYEVTPLEIAGAYTVFTTSGSAIKPSGIQMIRDRTGTVLHTHQTTRDQVLDPRAAFLTVDLMQEVMRSGTAAGVKARGFTVPAAGKTGTSHDGWFAGFTSKLLCIVWVGFDDNRELDLEGAKSALPIWTEFMKRALKYRDYAYPEAFLVPGGINKTSICTESGQLATPNCPLPKQELFIDGTQPSESCPLHQEFPMPQATVTSSELPRPSPTELALPRGTVGSIDLPRASGNRDQVLPLPRGSVREQTLPIPRGSVREQTLPMPRSSTRELTPSQPRVMPQAAPSAPAPNTELSIPRRSVQELPLPRRSSPAAPPVTQPTP